MKDDIETYETIKIEIQSHRDRYTYNSSIVTTSASIFIAVFLAFFVDKGYDVLIKSVNLDSIVLVSVLSFAILCVLWVVITRQIKDLGVIMHRRKNRKYNVLLDVLEELIIESRTKKTEGQ